jgi:hypothetical protein
MSLASLVPRWSGSEKAPPIAQFFASIDSAARVGNWTEADKVEVCTLKLTESAHAYYWATPELRDPTISWENFKEQLMTRFRDVHPDQYHYSEMHIARQRKNETPREFLDRLRILAADPVLQRAYQETTKKRLIASFTYGLSGLPGRQARLLRPRTVSDALEIAEETA